MAGRKVFNEQDARRCLAAVKSSRVDLGTWARAHGVDGRSLNLWRANLERRGGVRVRAAAPKLVEVVVVPTPGGDQRAPFLLRIGGVGHPCKPTWLTGSRQYDRGGPDLSRFSQSIEPDQGSPPYRLW